MAIKGSFLIHTVHTMTVRRYSELEQTNNTSLLKRWFNPLPIGWFDTDLFYNDVKSVLSKDHESDLDEDVHKLISYNTILLLDNLYNMIVLLNQHDRDTGFYSFIYKKDIPIGAKNTKFYIDKINELTGIDISNPDNLIVLKKHIQRKLDKYNENYKDEVIEDSEDFIDVVLSVFSIMGMAYMPTMNLYEFSKLKTKAEKRVEQNKPKDE